MESTFIPTKDDATLYSRALQRFLERQDVSARNKELVSTYLRESGIGKTARGRAKTKIGYQRRVSYLNTLICIIEFLQKDLDQVTDPDMQRFIDALEGGKIRSRQRFRRANGYFRSGAPLSPRYIVDIKMNVRRYYKYLLGDCKVYPPLVDWIDVYHAPKEIPALTENEVHRMVDHAVCTRDRALVQVLFDSGFRLGELMNVRLENVRLLEVAPGHKCFILRAPYSKTVARTVVVPMPETTKWLTYWLEEHPAQPTLQPDGTLAAGDLKAPLFPIKAAQINQVARDLGASALGKHVWTHLMRHTSATYWANKLPYFKFCKRFGWTMTSRMPQRYIDAAGIDELDTARIFMTSRQAGDATQDEANRQLMRFMRREPDAIA
jgi:integrase